MRLWRTALWWTLAVGPWTTGCSGCEDDAAPANELEDRGTDGSTSDEQDGAADDAPDAEVSDAETADAEVPDAEVPDASEEQLADAFEATPLYRSGSRLRARFYEAEGAPASFSGFHDTELDVDCSLQRADDGELRCMPQSGEFEVVFSDAACTQPILRGIGFNAGECTTDDPRFVIDSWGSGRPDCESTGVRAYRATTKRSNVMPFMVLDDSCEPVATTNCAFELEPVPASSFVRAELAVESRGDALEQTIVRFEDGAELASTLHDVERGVDCGPTALMPDFCVPVEQAHHFAGTTAGATCDGEDVAFDSGSACGLATVVVHWEPDCGGYLHSLFEVGARVSETSTLDAEGVCVVTSGHGGDARHLVGDPLDPKELPVLQLHRLGSDRLGLRYHTTPDLVPVSYGDPLYYDVSLDVPCSPLAVGDGYVCAPQGLSTSSWGPYEDDACTTPLAGDSTSFLSCAAELPPFIKRYNVASESERWYRRGPQAELPDGRLFGVTEAGACEPYDADPSYAYFRLGEPIDLAPIRGGAD